MVCLSLFFFIDGPNEELVDVARNLFCEIRSRGASKTPYVNERTKVVSLGSSLSLTGILSMFHRV